MPGTQVVLLDAPSVHHQGRWLTDHDLGGRRAVLCLAVLAVQAGRSVSREVLADAVWEDRRPPSWRANLRAVVSELRHALGDVVTSTSDGYRLDVPRAAVDVLALERHAADAEAADAVAAWELATEVLPPTGAVPLRGFDAAWSDRLRARVAESRWRLVVRAAEAAVELGRGRDAEPLARELVAAFPLGEDGHRLLMRALAAAGNRADALAAYDTCRRLLDEQLGVRPSPETEAVFLWLLRRSPTQPAVVRSDGARPRRPVEYLLSSAQLALDAGIFDDAARAAAAGLAALESAEEDLPPVRARFEVLLGAAQHQLGDPGGGVLLHRAAKAARERGDAGTLADAALAFTASEAAGGEVALNEALLDLYHEALAALDPDDKVRRTRLQSRIALALAWRTDHAAGREAAADAVDLAAATGDPALLMSTLCIARQTVTGSGALAAQAELETRLADLAGRLNDPAGRAKAAMWAFETAVGHGDGERLEQLLDEADRHAADVRAPAVLHPLAYSRAALSLLRGDLPLAAALSEEAASVGRRAGLAPLISEALRLVQFVPFWEASGRLAEHRDELVDFFGAPGLPEWSSMVAIAEAAAGNRDAADEHLTRFLDNYTEKGPSMIAPVALAAQLASPIATLGAPEHAGRLYPLLTPYAGQGAYIAHFIGPVDLSLGLLASTLGDRATATAHFQAGERFAARLGAPLIAARCRELVTPPRRLVVVPDISGPTNQHVDRDAS